MKKIINSSVSVLLILALVFSFAACGTTDDNKETGLWANATYLTDTELGEGATTVKVEVKAEDKTVTFTVKTDKKTVGEALLDSELIAGENGDYGLYVTTVNGITADYDADQSYWAFYIDGEYAMTGVDSTDITEGATYQLEYTKG